MKKELIIVFFLFISGMMHAQKFSKEEQRLILEADTTVMFKVIEVTNPEELKILKAVSTDINPKDKLIPILAKRMYLAMRDPLKAGVGIAAPQIGINRNIIWVQRFDKAGEPFELYINPKISWRSNLLRQGAEGCLSIPEERGDVYRNYTIQITYFDSKGQLHEELVEGFTAVIFQHETDHLNGILFTDRIIEQEEFKGFPISDGVNLTLEKKDRR